MEVVSRLRIEPLKIAVDKLRESSVSFNEKAKGLSVLWALTPSSGSSSEDRSSACCFPLVSFESATSCDFRFPIAPVVVWLVRRQDAALLDGLEGNRTNEHDDGRIKVG